MTHAAGDQEATTVDQLRTRTRDWIAEEVAPHADGWERQGSVPREVFRSFGHAGLLGIAYPLEHGGGGGTFLDQMTVAEELYYAGWGGLALSLLGHAGIALQPLAVVGTAAQQLDVLAPAIRGETIVGISVSEPGAGSDVSSLQTAARVVDGGWRLDGHKVFVTLGKTADVLVLAARIEGDDTGGISLFLVPTDTRGLQVVRLFSKLGMRSSETAEIVLEDCRIPTEALVGSPGEGFKAVMRQFQAERLILAAGSLAMARRAVDEIVSYTTQRRQFGRALADFQALRHRLADAAATVRALQVFTWDVASRYAAGEYPVTDISMAKLLSARGACDVVDDMLQMAGGWGYVDDLPLERLWRDVRLMRIGGGTDEIMREVIARDVVDSSR